MRKFAIVVIIAIFSFGMSSGAAIAGPGDTVEQSVGTDRIDECTVIKEPGKYQLTTDLKGSDGPCLVISDTRNVTVVGSDHEISGSNQGVEVENSANVTIENLVVGNVQRYGIEITESLNVAVRNTSVKATGEEGLYSRNSMGVTFHNNIVNDTGGFGGISTEESSSVYITDNHVVQFDTVGLRSAGSTDVQILNNTVINIGEKPDEHAPYNGIFMGGSSNITLKQNYFEGHLYGIQIGADNSGIFVIENEIRNSTLCAADVKSSNEISKNIVFDSNILVNHAGLDVERNATNVTIRNNIVRESRTFGIAIKRNSSKVFVYNNTVTNNTLSGIWMHPNHKRDGAFPRTIEIDNNTIRGNGIWGIEMGGVGNVEISNNSIEKNGKDGSIIENSNNVTFRYNVIQKNGLNISEADVSAGIRVAGNSQNISIRRNHFEGNGYGIWADSSTTRVNGTMNWWGSESGPGGYGSGDGDAVSDHVTYDPWLKSWPKSAINTAGTSTDASPGESQTTTDIEVESTETSQPGLHFVTGIIGMILAILLGLRKHG